MKKISCLVVDDEPLACKGLAEYISEVDSLQCLAAVHSAADAVKFLPQTDLLYLDINMPKISGIDFLKQVKNPPLTIITTAYPQYALEGYELDVVDYLLKPIGFPRFLKATTKAIEYFRLLHQPANKKEPAEHFFVKSNGMLEKILLEEIIAVEAMANYVILHTPERKIIAYLTLRQVKDYLPPGRFFQVHKSHIVAQDKISKIDHDIIHAGKLQVPVGANFREDVMKQVAGRVLKR